MYIYDRFQNCTPFCTISTTPTPHSFDSSVIIFQKKNIPNQIPIPKPSPPLFYG